LCDFRVGELSAPKVRRSFQAVNIIVTGSVGLALNGPYCVDPAGRRGFRDQQVTTTEQLKNVGAANKPDVLQAHIEARQEKVALENSRALYAAAWQQLAAYVGNPCLPLGRLEGNLDSPAAAPDYEAALAHLLEASPELQVARVEITRNQIGLKREQAEPIPNIQARVW
jgi:cobalt-zinc-cadmium efflux system outer membrane protein